MHPRHTGTRGRGLDDCRDLLHEAGTRGGPAAAERARPLPTLRACPGAAWPRGAAFELSRLPRAECPSSGLWQFSTRIEFACRDPKSSLRAWIRTPSFKTRRPGSASAACRSTRPGPQSSPLRDREASLHVVWAKAGVEETATKTASDEQRPCVGVRTLCAKFSLGQASRLRGRVTSGPPWRVPIGPCSHAMSHCESRSIRLFFVGARRGLFLMALARGANCTAAGISMQMMVINRPMVHRCSAKSRCPLALF